MRLEQLKYIDEIVNAGSIRNAAANLHLTQQTLSAAVKALERELELILFERSAQGVRLTAEGADLLPHFRVMLAEYDTVHTYASHRLPSNYQSVMTGTLRFACVTTISRFIIPTVSRRFQERYPAVDMSITEFPVGHYRNLVDPTFDIILFHVDRDEFPQFTSLPHYRTTSLLLDSLVITCGQNSPLNGKKAVSNSTLSKQPFAFFSVDEPEKIWTYRKVFSDHDLRPKSVFQTNVESSFYDKIMQTDYLALSSKFSTKNSDFFKRYQLSSVALKNKIEFYYMLAVSEKSQERPFVQSFIEILKDIFFKRST